MVTAEIGVGLGAVVLCLAVGLQALALGVDEVRCVDAAHVGARAAARGDPAAMVTALARGRAPAGSTVSVRADGAGSGLDAGAGGRPTGVPSSGVPSSGAGPTGDDSTRRVSSGPPARAEDPVGPGASPASVTVEVVAPRRAGLGWLAPGLTARAQAVAPVEVASQGADQGVSDGAAGAETASR